MVHWRAHATKDCCSADAIETTRLLHQEDEEVEEAEPEDLASLPASVVQFGSAQFFCMEDEGEAAVEVVRLGDAAGQAKCRYRTEDGSARAGVKFEAVSGELVFDAGEVTQTIRIPLIVSSTWDSTLEFGMVLTKVINARPGVYLRRCVVSIIDDDAFPTNKYKNACASEEELEKLSGPGLMLEYVRMNFADRNLRCRTILSILLDQVKNLYFLMTIYLQMYLVDVVLGAHEGGEGEVEAEGEGRRRLLLETIHSGARLLGRALGEEEEDLEGAPEGEGGEDELIVPGNRRYTAIVVGLLYVVPFFVNHAIDVGKISMGLEGRTRRFLQAALMRKFLTFREDVRGAISTGDLSMAMTRDISEVVDFGYMKLITMICVLGKLCYGMSFILRENQMAAVPLAVFLVIGGIFLVMREPLMIKSNEDMAEKQNSLVHTVHDIIDNYTIIRDFHLRPFIVRRYEQKVIDYNSRCATTKTIMANNSYLPPWLMTLLVGGYMVYGTFQVKSLGGTLSLGAYFATLSVFKEIGVEMGEVYMEMMEIIKVTGPLKKICFFMNQPTFLHQRMIRSRQLAAQGNERRMAARKGMVSTKMSGLATKDSGEKVFAVDTVSLELKGVVFSYDPGTALLKGLTLQFPQGKLFAFIGPEQQGKSTLLRMIGGVLIPEEGEVFIPPHMRVLHLTKEGMCLHESFLRNLVFDQDISFVGGYDRIRRICERVFFSPALLKLLDDAWELERQGSQEAADTTWHCRLSSTDFARLNLARALVMNPECLIMQMPFITFSDDLAKRMVDLVRLHVQERGLELPEKSRSFRRPRTVFFSSSVLERCKAADHIYEVSSCFSNLIREVPPKSGDG